MSLCFKAMYYANRSAVLLIQSGIFAGSLLYSEQINESGQFYIHYPFYNISLRINFIILDLIN